MTRQTFLALSLSMAGTLVLIGCGGGGGGGGTGDGSSSEVRSVRLDLPTGLTVTTSQLRLSGPQHADPIAFSTTGDAKVQLLRGARQLMAALDADGDPILIGFLGFGADALSTRSSVEALAYIEMGAFLVPEAAQPQVLDVINRSTELDLAAKQLAEALAANPKALTVKSGAYRTTITDYVNRHLGRTVTRGIEPYPSEKSGVRIEYGKGPNEFVAKNTFRRRALLILDRVAVVNADGVRIPSENRLSTLELKPAYTTNASGDLLSVMSSLQPSQSAPFTAPAPDAPNQKNIYRAMIAGPGASEGESFEMDTALRARYETMLQKSFCMDFLFNVLNFSICSNNVGQNQEGDGSVVSVYGQLQTWADANEAAISSFVKTEFPDAINTMNNGDFKTNLTTALTAVWGNEEKQRRVAAFYAPILRGLPAPPLNASETTVERVLGWIRRVVDAESVAGVVSDAFDRFQPGLAFSKSKRFESVTIETNRLKLELSPTLSSIDNSAAEGGVTLTTKLVGDPDLPAGAALKYRFSTTGRHGTLRNNQGGGGTTSLESVDDFVRYSANVGLSASAGEDTVTCELFYEAGGVRVNLANATATVEVKGKFDLEILPKKGSITVQGGDSPSFSFQAKLASEAFAARLGLSVRWRTQSEFFSVSSNGKQCQVTGLDKTGVGTLIAELVDSAGVVRGTAQAEVRVEPRRTIIFGTVAYLRGESREPARDSRGREYFWLNRGAGAGLSIPRIKDAKSYAIYCYNFNDPNPQGHGKEIRQTIAPSHQTNLGHYDPDGVFNGPNSTHYYVRLNAGGSSSSPVYPGQELPPDNTRNTIAGMQNRFKGMIVEVTVTF